MAEKLIIIGAGINGLMCAYHLLKKGNIDIEIYDQGLISNPLSASYGKHRLIHPWSEKDSVQNARKALASLTMWQAILDEIGSDSFVQTGVFALRDSNIDDQAYQNIDIKLLSIRDIVDLMPLLEDADGGYVHNFPQFGVLFADKVVTDLVQYLQKNGVQFYERHSVVSVDAQTGNVCFSDGKMVVGDRIIIAAGYGADAIVSSSFKEYQCSLPSFRPMRCYVAYVKHPKIKVDKIMPAWASLGMGDMWGMPPLRGIPMKLGCGDFTKPCDPLSADDSHTIAQEIVGRYKQLFPKFDGLEIEGAGVNHWTEIDSVSDYTEIDRAIIITSDNGSGFKFAPVVSLKVANSLSASLCNDAACFSLNIPDSVIIPSQ